MRLSAVNPKIDDCSALLTVAPVNCLPSGIRIVPVHLVITVDA
jgi:hypothetical protein